MCSNIPTKPTYGVYISQLISESVIILLKALCQYISSNWLLYLTPDAVRCRVVDWRSGNIPDLSVARLGGFAVGSVLGRTLAACGDGKSLCVRPVCMYGLWCAHS